MYRVWWNTIYRGSIWSLSRGGSRTGRRLVPLYQTIGNILSNMYCIFFLSPILLCTAGHYIHILPLVSNYKTPLLRLSHILILLRHISVFSRPDFPIYRGFIDYPSRLPARLPHSLFRCFRRLDLSNITSFNPCQNKYRVPCNYRCFVPCLLDSHRCG